MIIDLTDRELRSILLVLRTRQDDCRRVTNYEHPHAKKDAYRELDAQLEKLKMKIAGQL